MIHGRVRPITWGVCSVNGRMVRPVYRARLYLGVTVIRTIGNEASPPGHTCNSPDHNTTSIHCATVPHGRMLGFLRRGANRGRHRGPTSNQSTSRKTYALWWTGLLLMHCINFCYYAGVTKLYNSFRHAYVYVMINMLSIGIDNTEYAKVSVIHAAIAAVHGVIIFIMVGSSIYARRLMFQPELSKLLPGRNTRCGQFLGYLLCCISPRATSSVAASNSDITAWFRPLPPSSDRVSSTRTQAHRVSETIINTGSMIFARDGLLGVDSVYFDHVLLLRELVETSLQTYQVYRMSQLLPRLWLIRFYVALLVINCWGVPILHRYYRDRETTRRMLCLLCDAVLDMVSSIGISLIIFATYAPQYNDPDGFGFPFANWFNDHWMANMQQEFQVMLVASWTDMASRLVFALGLLQCMQAIKEVLTPASSPTIGPLAEEGKKELASSSKFLSDVTVLANSVQSTSVPKPTLAVDESNDKGDQKRADGTRGTEPIKTGPEMSTASPSVRGSSKRKRFIDFLIHVAGPGVFVVWGVAILAIHLIAETHQSDNNCTLQLKPWLSSKSGCSIVEVNCHDLQSNGHDEAIALALERFDAERAARVVFRHCPALVIPTKIQEFHSMAGLKIYNSTLVSWAETSALTGTKHPSMRSIYLVRVQLPNGEIPSGLLDTAFPPLMAEFVTCVTNLRALPDDLDRRWSPRLKLVFEFSLLTSIPDVVLRLQPSTVSVAGSPVTSVPAELFEIQSLTGVILGMTRVKELPSNVTRPSRRMNVLFLQHTNVTTFWSWMDGFIEYSMLFPTKLFNAHGTPFCEELQAISSGSRSGFSLGATSGLATVMDVSTPEKLEFARNAVDCGPGFPTNFPLPLEDGVNGLH